MNRRSLFFKSIRDFKIQHLYRFFDFYLSFSDKAQKMGIVYLADLFRLHGRGCSDYIDIQQTVVLKKAGKKRFSRALSFLAFCLYYCGYSASWKNRPFGSIGSDAASLPSKIRPISSTGRIPCPISRSVEMMIRAIL